MQKKYGYVRVSTKQQNIDRQVSSLLEAGLDEKNIFVDKISGKDFKRPSYKRLIKKLKAGDALFIKSIDRLGRNYDEIIEQWNFLTKERDIDIVVLDFPLLDTRNDVNGITGKFLADMVLQVLSYVAQVEKDNILQRQAEGIKEAKKKGIRFGRPKKQIPSEFGAIYQMWEREQISKREAARRLNITHRTFTTWAVDHEQKNRTRAKN
ncbi:DNA invertase Pin-like site-specific DNA recombinase [Bacilli bacterium PM5-3]|nr:DNA invertase Pin-like site-specific DNA recombinase [Bacilli bacterium PM5-3]MDH6604319.1 DNA invertase Pin-like site-specific DNA recombinase [Bacilli bacterium PM5-9]